MIKKIKSNCFIYPILIVLVIILLYKCIPQIRYQTYFNKIEVNNTLKYIITTENKPKLKFLNKLAIKLSEKQDFKEYSNVEYYFIDETTKEYLWDYSRAIVEQDDNYNEKNHKENREKIETLCNDLSLKSNYGYVSISKGGVIENNIKDINYKNYPSLIARIKFPSNHPVSTKDYYADLDEQYHKEFIAWINYLGGTINDN